MRTYFGRLASLAFFVVALGIFSSTAAAQAGGGAPVSSGDLYSRVADYLKRSGLSYRKLNQQGWLVDTQDEKVLLGVQDNFMLVGIIVTKKGDFSESGPAMKSMLVLANELDYVKIGIDDDGDLLVRTEWKGESLSRAAFDEMIEGVVGAAKRVRSKIGQY